jgi:hypothetical protein
VLDDFAFLQSCDVEYVDLHTRARRGKGHDRAGVDATGHIPAPNHVTHNRDVLNGEVEIRKPGV